MWPEQSAGVPGREGPRMEWEGWAVSDDSGLSGHGGGS